VKTKSHLRSFFGGGRGGGGSLLPRPNKDDSDDDNNDHERHIALVRSAISQKKFAASLPHDLLV